MAYFKSGDNQSAAKALEKAIELEPNELKARFYLSQVKIALKDYAGGVQMMEQVVDMDPSDPEWRRELAAALRKAGRSDEADTVMKKAHMLGVEKTRKKLTAGKAACPYQLRRGSATTATYSSPRRTRM